MKIKKIESYLVEPNKEEIELLKKTIDMLENLMAIMNTYSCDTLISAGEFNNDICNLKDTIEFLTDMKELNEIRY